MRTPENLSPAEEAIKVDWQAGLKSIRQIAKDHKVSDTWVRKLAAKHHWGERPKRGSQAGSQRRDLVPMVIPVPREEPEARESAADGDGSSETIRKAARAEPDELIDDARQILARLRDELDAVTCHPGELDELIEAATAGDENDRRRTALQKAVSLPTRILAAKNLALAMKTLAEAAPGKKEEAQRKAAARGTGRFATPEVPDAFKTVQ